MNNFWDRIKQAGLVATIFAILIFLIKIALKNAYFMSIIYRFFD
tara:strand:- start:3205 stop:3336 length:132 start_codon:yes stop_codon:yes gene_type:complete